MNNQEKIRILNANIEALNGQIILIHREITAHFDKIEELQNCQKMKQN